MKVSGGRLFTSTFVTLIVVVSGFALALDSLILAAWSGGKSDGIGNGMMPMLTVEETGMPSGISPFISTVELFSLLASSFRNATYSAAPAAALATHCVPSN